MSTIEIPNGNMILSDGTENKIILKCTSIEITNVHWYIAFIWGINKG